MAEIRSVICDTELGRNAPDWVHLAGPGRTIARDGRLFDLTEPGDVLAAFRAGGVDLPIDYEHQSEGDLKRRSGPVPAAGWIKELKVDQPGLWGRVEWTEAARKLILEKAYRYISPSFLVEKGTGRIARLAGAGLVHRPALYLKALALQEGQMTEAEDFQANVAELLGLPEDADFEAILDALQELVATSMVNEHAAANPDSGRFVPICAVQELVRDRNEDRRAQARMTAKAKVDAALQAGYISPGMKSWATELCAQDVESFDRFLACAVPAFAHLMQPALPRVYPDQDEDPVVRGLAGEIEEQLGLKRGTVSE